MEGLPQYQFADQNLLHPIALAAMLGLGLATLLVSKRNALFPLIAMACFIAPAQRIVIATLDFNLIRVMLVFGWMRLIFRGEVQGLQWKKIDKAVLLWAISGTIAYSLYYATASAVIFRLGWMFDCLATYFLIRCLVRDWDDVERLVGIFILLSVPTAIAFLLEKSTGRNAFSIFGGVPEITPIRGGRLRCQGAFPHPILAGCFWASLMPLIASRLWRKGKQGSVLVGLGASMAIVILSASSTPMMAVVAGLVGAVLFPFREKMRTVRWGILLTLCGLHMVMKAPVWQLIARIDLVGGSTGWHRYALIDAAIRNFREWFLLGTRSTAHWGYYLFDVTNQYILEGVRGGVITLILFLGIIVRAFGGVGLLWRSVAGETWKLAFSWSLGVCLFTHIISFLAVSYFDQMTTLWMLTLGIVGSMVPQAAPEPAPARVGSRTAVLAAAGAAR